MLTSTVLLNNKCVFDMANITDEFRSDNDMTQNQFYAVHVNGWNAHESLEDVILDHWKSYPTPNPFIHYIFGVIYSFFFVVSCIGNGVIIWVFLGSKSLRIPSNMFIISLAVTDFLMMAKTPIFIYNSFNEGPVASRLWCNVYGAIGMLSGGSGLITNYYISFERYRTIIRPLDKKLTKLQVFLLISLQFILVIPSSVLPTIGLWGRFVPVGYLTSCGPDYITPNLSCQSYIITLFVLFFFVPGLLTLFNYIRIYVHVRAHNKCIKEQTKRMNVNQIKKTETREVQEKISEIRVAKVGASTFLLHIISWTPYATITLIGISQKLELLTPFVAMLPALFCKMVACFNPFIYAINHPKYRLELMQKIPWFCVHEEDLEDDKPKESENEPSERN